MLPDAARVPVVMLGEGRASTFFFSSCRRSAPKKKLVDARPQPGMTGEGIGAPRPRHMNRSHAKRGRAEIPVTGFRETCAIGLLPCDWDLIRDTGQNEGLGLAPFVAAAPAVTPALSRGAAPQYRRRLISPSATLRGRGGYLRRPPPLPSPPAVPGRYPSPTPSSSAAADRTPETP